MAAKTSSNARWFIADDNNFMTDEFILDSVADISETNYSIVQKQIIRSDEWNMLKKMLNLQRVILLFRRPLSMINK